MSRHELKPDLVVGSSVGALNGAFWAFHPGPTASDELLRAWLEVDRSNVLWDSPVRWVRRLLSHHDHLLGHSAEQALIARRFGPHTLIEEASFPIAIVATDVDSGECVVLRQGNLATALLATIAIPGLFAPVAIDGRRLVDGGVVANCSLEAVAAAGIRKVLVVDPIGDSRPASRGDLIIEFEHAVALSLRRQTDLAIRAHADQMDVTLLRPALSWPPRLFDFSHTRELFELGRAAGEGFVAQEQFLAVG
jgi:NTE family protein